MGKKNGRRKEGGGRLSVGRRIVNGMRVFKKRAPEFHRQIA